MNQKYQVALSFAGEERAYVEEVARHLQDRSIAVFYDDFETVRLWGRSGTEAFDDVFGRQSAYVVMFISAAYVSKAWPRHERRSALSRMIREQHEYILPVRFDDSCVPGLPADILYYRARDHTPAQLAGKIASKLGIKPFEGKASQVPPPRMTSPTGEVVFDYSSHNGRYIIGSGMLEFETMWTKASDTSISVYNDPPSINGVALAQGCESISQVESAESLDYTSRTRTPSLGQIVVLRNTEGFYAAVHVIEIKDNSRHDDRDELRFRYAIQSDGSDNFTEFPITADADSISGVGPKPSGCQVPGMALEETVCPICGAPATLLSTGEPKAVRRINSTCAAGLYDITFQAELLLARPDLVRADDGVAIEEWLNSQRSGDGDNPPCLTMDDIRRITGQPHL